MQAKNNFVRPPALKQGDLIQIVAPASPFKKEFFLRGVEKIKQWGFKVRYREDIWSKHRYLAGDDERRAQELIEALQDSKVKAIFLARGGYGSMRLLPYLDRLESPPPPKLLLGYSDFTSILNYVQQKWGWVAFHGPVVSKDISDRLAVEGEASLLQALTQRQPIGQLNGLALKNISSGQAQGILVGGCLSLVVCSLGTPYQIQTRDKILYLEDVGELLYSIDRMLTHLRQANIFDGLRGILLGPFQDAHHDDNALFDLLKELLGDLKIPVLYGFPSGHQENSYTIPLGVPVQLEADQGTVTFLESAVI